MIVIRLGNDSILFLLKFLQNYIIINKRGVQYCKCMFKIVIKVYKIILYTPEMGILKAKKSKKRKVMI